MEYNEEEFKNDLYLCKFIYFRHFLKYGYEREDLIQEGVIALWKTKNLYDNKKGSINTFKYIVAKNAMLMFICKYYKNKDKNISLYSEFCDNLTYDDILKGDVDVDISNQYLFDLHKIINECIERTIKNNLIKEMIKEYLFMGLSPKEISLKFNYNYSNCRRYLSRYKVKIKKELLKNYDLF